MKNNVVTPSKPLFYKRYVDDIYNCCKRYITDTLSENLYNYHDKINSTCETNLKKFLDTEMITAVRYYGNKRLQKPNQTATELGYRQCVFCNKNESTSK